MRPALSLVLLCANQLGFLANGDPQATAALLKSVPAVSADAAPKHPMPSAKPLPARSAPPAATDDPTSNDIFLNGSPVFHVDSLTAPPFVQGPAGATPCNCSRNMPAVTPDSANQGSDWPIPFSLLGGTCALFLGVALGIVIARFFERKQEPEVRSYVPLRVATTASTGGGGVLEKAVIAWTSEAKPADRRRAPDEALRDRPSTPRLEGDSTGASDRRPAETASSLSEDRRSRPPSPERAAPVGGSEVALLARPALPPNAEVFTIGKRGEETLGDDVVLVRYDLAGGRTLCVVADGATEGNPGVDARRLAALVAEGCMGTLESVGLLKDAGALCDRMAIEIPEFLRRYTQALDPGPSVADCDLRTCAFVAAIVTADGFVAAGAGDCYVLAGANNWSSMAASDGRACGITAFVRGGRLDFRVDGAFSAEAKRVPTVYLCTDGAFNAWFSVHAGNPELIDRTPWHEIIDQVIVNQKQGTYSNDDVSVVRLRFGA